MAKKKGPLTKKEKEYILSKCGVMTAAAIAARLDREEEMVGRFIEKNHVPDADGEGKRLALLRQDFKESQEYKRAAEGLTENELIFFEDKYARLCLQFNNDVLPTESTQMSQSIKLEILMDRNMAARKKLLGEIEALEKVLRRSAAEFGKSGEGPDEQQQNFLVDLGKQLEAARRYEQGKTAEYTDLQGEHLKLTDKLKATRDQRIKDVDTGKESWLSLLKSVQQQKVAEKEGRFAELMRMAAENEAERLSRPHVYKDGSQDLPILSADTIGKWDEGEVAE